MRRTPHLMILAATALCLAPFTGNAQTVLEEDFETPDTANFITFVSADSIVTATNTWFVTANSVDLYEAAARPEAAAFDGAQAVDLTGSPGEGIIETVFSTAPGTSYEVVFHYARNAFVDPDTACARVDVIGSAPVLQAVVQHNPSTHSFDTYLQYQGTFVADSTETTLRFTGLDPGVAGLTIDGISVSEVTPSGIGAGQLPHVRDGIRAVFPNPFGRTVAIDYVTVEAGFVQADIFDIRGRFIATLIHGQQNAGPHTVTWAGKRQNGSTVESGIYFAVLTTSQGTSNRKLVLLK